MQSSWGDEGRLENHKGPHYVLTVWPNGKLILTTPDKLTRDEHENISAVFQRWLRSEEPYPLIIGDCLVQVMTVPVTEVSVAK